MSVRVQFVLREAEYEELKRMAEGKGVSISKYVKDCVFAKNKDSDNDNSFEEIWREFCDKLSSFPANVEFSVSNIMTQERWQDFDRSTKLSISKLFNKKVTSESPEYSNIKVVGRSASNVSLYIKTHL